MRGQVVFFDSKKNFGIVKAETGGQAFLSGHELAEIVEANNWVAFDEERNLVCGTKCDWVAKNVHRIDCPTEYLLQGKITKFFPGFGYGFIRFEHDGQMQSIYFHCHDFLRVDGVEHPVPCVGCVVSFCLGQKFDKPIAVQIWIERWPENGLENVEKYFEQAPELPVEVPKAVPARLSSVLSPATRNLTLLEIIRRRERNRSRKLKQKESLANATS